MKRILFAGLISCVAMLGLTGCYKTCEDPFAPNYTMEGSCIDLTSSITGIYNGQLQDSIVGLHSTTVPAAIQITKVDDGHVAIAAYGATSYVGYNAVVSQSSNGYYLMIPSQTATNGLTVTGAGTYFGAASDGVFISANKQMTVYALAGTQYEGFTGILQ